MTSQSSTRRVRIAHLSGPNATITNTPPLVTSNKARSAKGLPLLTDIEGNPSRFDPLRPQRLAAAATVYVEQFSAHPLEADLAELYGDPDGYVDAAGEFSTTRNSLEDKPVYKVELLPEDGYFPLPYMALQADGSPWDADGTGPRVPRDKSRQPFMPDGSRVFEEVDRLGVDGHGHGSAISNLAEVDFFRLAPSGGYTKGLAAEKRTDKGEGDIAPEVAGKDFFPYRPPHLNASPSRMSLAAITNAAQRLLSGGEYDGAIWTQGSPRIEETVYWFNLVLDVTVPVCGNASQRYHGQISNDGPKNLADSTDYIHSRIWAGEDGRNLPGVVMVQDQRIFAAREVTKGDARPGGYEVAGGHGGLLGAAGGGTGSVLRYIPVMKHTWKSDVNVTRMPASVNGNAMGEAGIESVSVPIKDASGDLLPTAIPKVSIVKDASYIEDDYDSSPEQEVDVLALIDYKLNHAPLSGFVLEGLNPYGKPAATSKTRALLRAVCSGFPVVNCGRGTTQGFAIKGGPFISGSNLTAIKARILLMACLMNFGMLPAARDPRNPTAAEMAAIEKKLAIYQAVFDTH